MISGKPSVLSRVWTDPRQGSPFVHRFETGRCKYVYDINTGEILKVDDVVWDVIEYFGAYAASEIAVRYGAKYDPEPVLRACSAIHHAQTSGNVLHCTAPEVTLATANDRSEVDRLLAGSRLHLILNVTESCDFRCSYCRYTHSHYAGRNHSARRMSWEVARKALSDFLEHCAKGSAGDPARPSISFHGGEPLTNFPLIERCVRFVRANTDRRIRFSVVTNGSRLHGRIAEFLAFEGFGIAVSLDGPEHIHDRNRRTRNGAPTWERVMRNLTTFWERYHRHVSDRKAALRINAVLSPDADPLEVVDFFSRSNAIPGQIPVKLSLMSSLPECDMTSKAQSAAHANLAVLHDRYLDNLVGGRTTSREFSLQQSLFGKWYGHIHRRHRERGESSPTASVAPLPTSMCTPGVRRYSVSARGDYYPCERLPERPAFAIGSIRDGLRVDRAVGLVRRFFECGLEACKSCWCMRLCDVGCYVDIREGCELTEEVKNAACVSYRARMHEILINYCRVLEENPQAFKYLDAVTIG